MVLGLKHKDLLSNKKKSLGLKSLFSKQHQGVTESEEACAAPAPASVASSTTSTPVSNASSTITSYVTKNNVLDAEIIWALKCIRSHLSYNSSEDSHKLFARMFPDSAIAQMFTCGATKSVYV
ncbi:hypothetical protein AVEN_34399-1 [Araneus ventricosus]|uniref:Uncharacterized protein n=1 Tax=Araneus ventricosus TaxID=182803 RepID=A0A4Y2G5T3_ARAVE|nr:hypothetical protein AVEN_34399-1 [Araneus ventricosus]